MSDVDITFGADFKDVKDELSGLRSDINAWAEGVKKAGITAFAAWASTKAFGLIRGALGELQDTIGGWINAASEAAEIDKRLEIALRGAGEAAGFSIEELRDMASELQRVSIFGDEAIKSAQAILLRFKLTGEQFVETQQLAVDMASALGMDVTQAAQTLGMALQNPARGMMLLRRQGVTFTQEQRELIKIMIETGDTAGAQAVLMEALETAYGGAGAVMAQTGSGPMKQLLEVFGDIREELGGALLPIINELLPVIKEVARAFQDWAASVKDAVLGSTETWVPAVRELLINLFAWIKTAIQETIEEFNNLRLRAEEIKAYWDFVNDSSNWNPFNTDMTDTERRLKDVQERIGEGIGQAFDDRMKANVEQLRGALNTARKELDAASNEDKNKPDEETAARARAAKTRAAQLREAEEARKMWEKEEKAQREYQKQYDKDQKERREAARLAKVDGFDDIVAGIRASQQGRKGFSGGVEDAASLFSRIQTAAGSTDDIPARQLTALEQQLLKMDDEIRQQEFTNKSLAELVNLYRGGNVAVAAAP